MKSEITNRTRNTTNRIFAIPIAAPAMVVKPSRAATSATTKKIIDQDNMRVSFLAITIAPGLPRFNS